MVSSIWALSVLLQVLAIVSPQALAAPSLTPATSLHSRTKCTTLRLRKEWRDLTVEERSDYIRAVKCLMTIPAKVQLNGVKTRFDEFQASHITLTDEVHQVGHFLPWHRKFCTLYATAMREECGYEGPATYWDWSRDADSTLRMRDSPVFDEVTGFGGDGVPGTYTPPPGGGFPSFPGFPAPSSTGTATGTATSTRPSPTFTFPFPTPTGGFPGFPTGGCVQTGPFNETKINLGPGTNVGEHCLVRAINDNVKSSLTSANVDFILSQTTYETFRTRLENGGGGVAGMGIHGGGHGAVGGEMINPYSSPGDPLFYLHHGNLDRIWWKWQQADPENRMYAISGPTTQTPPFTNITLDFKMPFTTLIEPVAVRDVMDIESELNCFQYND